MTQWSADDGPDAAPAGPVGPVGPAPLAREPWFERVDLRLAVITIAVLAVLGAVAGLGWAAWSRTATRGLLYTKTAIIPDQTEGFISSDGRFIVITAVIGLVAGLAVWRRRAERGPVAAMGLAVGAVLGAVLTDLVGRLVGGGTTNGSVGTIVTRLPLRVHALGALFVEAALALAVYVICAAFVNPDDLGRARTAGTDSAVPPLVGAGLDLQQPGGDRDAAGAAQQDDLAP
jgi:hypothetical protein